MDKISDRLAELDLKKNPSLKSKQMGQNSWKRRARDLFPEEDFKSEKKLENTTTANTAYENKILGNIAYSQKDFEQAMLCYKKAIEQDPTEMVYYINIAAVFFECKKYQECIQFCLKAVEISRARKTPDRRLVAKAFTRIAKAYAKLNSLQMAKTYCEKAFDVEKHPETETLLRDIEKKLKESQFRRHVDPVHSEEENDIGNKLYENENFEEALIHFTEAVRANPNNPKMYINKAACLAKLEKFERALRAVDVGIKLDEKLVQGYILKGKILEKLKRTNEARDAFKKALEIDPKNAIALFGCQNNTTSPGNIQLCSEKPPSESDHQGGPSRKEPKTIDMDDPELKDIFENAFEDPENIALQLSNPKVAQKVQKIFFD